MQKMQKMQRQRHKQRRQQKRTETQTEPMRPTARNGASRPKVFVRYVYQGCRISCFPEADS